MRAVLATSLFGLSAAFTASERDSGIKKVIQLLGELKTKVENETAQGQKDAEDYADWCIKSTAELSKDVEYGGQKKEELAAALEDGSAKAAAAGQEAATLSPQIGKLQEEQKGAAEVRSKEHNDFVKEEAELTEADTMLQKAYAVLKRNLSLMQTGASNADEETVRNVVSALGVIIDSAWIDEDSVSKIKSFLEAEDGLELKQPQATASNYQSKSGGILDAIQGMQEKNAQVLGKLREKEMNARHKFELLVQDLKNQENSITDQVSALKETEAKSTAAAKQAEADLATTTESLEADTADLSETKAGCAQYAKDWEARQASATEEISVIQQAIEILSGKFGLLQKSASSFLQIASEDETLVSKSVDAKDYERRSNAAMILRRLSHEFNSFGLMQVAVAAQDDPFVKVRGMIKDMISKLEEEAQKEASKEAKCKADKAKGEKQLKIKKAQYEKLLSRSDAASAKFVKLGEEVKDLQTQLSDLASSVKEATEIRNKEKADNEATIKDSAESVEALTKAIEVLSKFYGAPAAALVQTGQPQTDSANVIMEILATSQEDFEKLKQTTESSEADAAEKYATMKQDSEVTKAKKTAEMEGKVKERAGVKVLMTQITEDLGEAGKALEAASSFLKGVKEACANKAMSYEERKKRRETEVKGLEEALQILSSDEGEFLQTGFMSKKN